ncbi:MAG: hypothetical protein ACYCPH_01005 [Minisyncoccota bacterium]
MQMLKKHWIIATGIGIAIVAGAAAGVWYDTAKTNIPVTTAIPTAISAFPINPADTIASWTFKGAYTGNATLMQNANTDLTHLKGLLGKGQYDNYDLYIGIGNDDNLMGNGSGAYKNYNRAIALYPNQGLAYTNLAHLMDELGAYHTAADAYGKAVAVQPSVLEYHLERLAFLTRQFPKDNALILAAFTDASKQFGDTPSVLAIEAQWLTGQGRYADAIKAWETVKMLSPQDRQAAIDAEIARLKAKG